MYAVIRTGGKQYRVAENDRIVVEKLGVEPGETVELADVLMLAEDGKAPAVGTPVLADAKVFAEVVEQARGEKILVFKKKRRKGYRRLKGHRQDATVLRITGISADGKAPKPAAKAKAKAKPKTDAEPAPEAEVAAPAPAPQAEAETVAPETVAPETTAAEAAPEAPPAEEPAPDAAADAETKKE